MTLFPNPFFWQQVIIFTGIIFVSLVVLHVAETRDCVKDYPNVPCHFKQHETY